VFWASRKGRADSIQSRSQAVESAVKLAAENFPEPALEKLSRDEIEKRIMTIDRVIEGRHLVERSNRAELNEAELKDLRRLLHERNRFFLRKLDLD
jgi:hypothetical protein